MHDFVYHSVKILMELKSLIVSMVQSLEKLLPHLLKEQHLLIEDLKEGLKRISG